MNEIKELYYRKEITTRSLNVCHINKLDSLEKIKKHFTKHGCFTKLYNCGGKSNLELISLCEKYKDVKNLWVLPEYSDKKLDDFIKKLTYAQKYSFSLQVKETFNQLDNRTKNAIYIYLKNDFSIENLQAKQVLKEHFPIHQIKGLGKKTSKIAKGVFLKLRNDLLNSNFGEEMHVKESELSKLFLKYIPKAGLSDLDLKNENYFKNVDCILKSKSLFSFQEQVFIKHKLILFEEDTFMSPKKLHNEFGLTNKEINSLRASVFKKFKRYFAFLKEFKPEFELNYKLNSKNDYLDYPKHTYSKIRDLQEVQFTDAFISYLIGFIYCDNFNNVGYYKSCLSKLMKNRIKSNSKYHFKTYHQVKSKLAKKCDFSSLLSFINDNQINLDSLSESQKIELINLYTTSHLDQIKLRLFNCAEQILERERQC